jgi:choline dehydrogenase-like flavoprotein
MFDYLIIGGGSAGSVLAGRLSEDPRVKVCLLEAGGPDQSVLIHCPAGLALLAQTTHSNWAFETVPQPGLNGRKGYQPRGKVLGGSSSINAMCYVRGQQADYNLLQKIRGQRARGRRRLCSVPRQRRATQRDGPAQPQPLWPDVY